MAYKAQRNLRKLKQVNLWGVIAGILFLVVLIVIGFYVYTVLQIGRMENELVMKEAILGEKRTEFRNTINDPWYKKYAASKRIEADDIVNWKDTIEYLVQMYDTIAQLDDDSSGMTLTDFAVTFDLTVNLRGNIDNIRTMYLPDGLIDRFTDLDAIESINIPFYRNNGESYDFVLDAIIKEDESA